MPAKTSQINALLVANKHKVNQSECVSVRIKTLSGSNYRSETSFSSKSLCRGSFCFSDLCLAFAVFCWTHTNLPSGNCLFTGSKVEQRKRPKKLKWEFLFFFMAERSDLWANQAAEMDRRHVLHEKKWRRFEIHPAGHPVGTWISSSCGQQNLKSSGFIVITNHAKRYYIIDWHRI